MEKIRGSTLFCPEAQKLTYLNTAAVFYNHEDDIERLTDGSEIGEPLRHDAGVR